MDYLGADMHPLLASSLRALTDPEFRGLFAEFLALQRYDLAPYVHLFGTLPDDDRSRRGTLTVGAKEVSAPELVARFIDHLVGGTARQEVFALAQDFWETFADAIGSRGPRECLVARRDLEGQYERHFMMPLLGPQLRQVAPRRVLDFGCGLNRLAVPLQQDFRARGKPIPTVTGVDVELRPGALEDPERGIHLRNLQGQPPSAVLDAPVDLVIVKYVLHHMSPTDQGRVMVDLAEVLEPGGTLLVLEASVGAEATDRDSFAKNGSEHPAWPREAWAEPYRSWSTRFYRASPRHQTMLVCLEDTFGHVLLPGPGPDGVAPMPLPYSYLSRAEATELAAAANLGIDQDLSAVLGLPPSLKYGPPSSLWVFRRLGGKNG